MSALMSAMRGKADSLCSPRAFPSVTHKSHRGRDLNSRWPCRPKLTSTLASRIMVLVFRRQGGHEPGPKLDDRRNLLPWQKAFAEVPQRFAIHRGMDFVDRLAERGALNFKIAAH